MSLKDCSAYLENYAHFSQIACRQLALVTDGWRKCSGQFVLHCLHSIGYSLDSVFIFWIQFWCMIPAMQKTLIACGWKDIFYSKREIIVLSFSWKFNTDQVFGLFSLFCKWIDVSMEWPKSTWIPVLKMLNGGAEVGPLGQTCPRGRVPSALSQCPFLNSQGCFMWAVGVQQSQLRGFHLCLCEEKAFGNPVSVKNGS